MPINEPVRSSLSSLYLLTVFYSQPEGRLVTGRFDERRVGERLLLLFERYPYRFTPVDWYHILIQYPTTKEQGTQSTPFAPPFHSPSPRSYMNRKLNTTSVLRTLPGFPPAYSVGSLPSFTQKNQNSSIKSV